MYIYMHIVCLSPSLGLLYTGVPCGMYAWKREWNIWGVHISIVMQAACEETPATKRPTKPLKPQMVPVHGIECYGGRWCQPWGKMMPAMPAMPGTRRCCRHSLDLYRYYWRHAIIRTYILLKKLVRLGCISEGFLCGSHQPKVLISPDVSAAHCCLHQW